MLYIFASVLNKLGAKKLAVRVAIKVDATSKHGDAAWDLIWNQTVYPDCPSCFLPILPSDPHVFCEEYERERLEDERIAEEAAWEAYQAELAQEAVENEDEDLSVEDDSFDDEDESISSTEVYNRAYAHFGNHEMAREAAEMYPGDFM